MAERLLDDHAPPAVGLVGGVVHEARGLQLLGDQREVLRRDRQVVRVVAHRAALDVELLDGLARAAERVGVVELARHEADALQQLLPGLFAELGARVLLDGVVHDLREVLVLPVARANPTSAKPGGSSPRLARSYTAGMSFLRDRSPVTPKMTSALGPGDAVEAAVVGVAQRVGSARDLDRRHSDSLREGRAPTGRLRRARALRRCGIGQRQGHDRPAVRRRARWRRRPPAPRSAGRT